MPDRDFRARRWVHRCLSCKRQRYAEAGQYMVITIDGPAGAGKSRAALRLAQRLDFHFLDTGAMYRAVALEALRQGIGWDQHARLDELARDLVLDVNEDRVLLNGDNVTQEIRTIQVTSVIHHVADHPGIRETLVALQRQTARNGNYVTEGRDQGTVVFPDAVCKIFLSASPEERARRRMLDMHARGENLPFDEVLRLQNERDQRDQSRDVGRLVPAPDAELFDTDGRSLDEVVEHLVRIAREKIGQARMSAPT